MKFLHQRKNDKSSWPSALWQIRDDLFLEFVWIYVDRRLCVRLAQHISYKDNGVPYLIYGEVSYQHLTIPPGISWRQIMQHPAAYYLETLL